MNYRILTLAALTPAQWEEAAAVAAQVDAALGLCRNAPEAAQRQHRAGWWLASQMIAEETGVPFLAEDLTLLPGGKPVLKNRAVGFSISHAGDHVLCAVHTGAVGADIETRRPVTPALIRRVCTAPEAAYVGEDPLRFLEIWTAKEAYIKFTGRGLSTGLHTVTVANEAGLLPAVNGHPLTAFGTADYRAAILIEK